MRAVGPHADQFAKRLDTEVGEREDFIVADAMDPYAAVFSVHFAGHLGEPALIDREVLRHAADRCDMMDLVDGPDQAAREIAIAGGDQFHGRNSSIRCAGWVAMRARTSASQA